MNEPYQRVSKDNGIVDGSLIGMGIGGSVAGLGVGASYLHYKDIDRKAPLYKDGLDALEADNQSAVAKAQRKLANTHSPKKSEKLQRKIDKYNSNLENISNNRERLSASSLKQRHNYSKNLGGWKNAAAIGAGAVIGGGIGMIADELHK